MLPLPQLRAPPAAFPPPKVLATAPPGKTTKRRSLSHRGGSGDAGCLAARSSTVTSGDCFGLVAGMRLFR